MEQIPRFQKGPKIRNLLIFLFFVFYGSMYAGWKPSIHVNAGETFTVYSTHHTYTQSVAWQWDSGALELVGNLYPTSTSATFRAKHATPVSGVGISATTYYHRNNSTSSGLNKEVDHWTVFVEDNSNVSLSANNITLNQGESSYLKAYLSNGSYEGEVEWSSSNSGVVSISGWDKFERQIHADGVGYATIRVSLDNGNYAECNVSVVSSDPTGISLPSSITLDIEESRSIDATLQPNGATSDINWWSDNNNIAKVDGYGRITGIAAGSTKIWAKTVKGGFTDYCTVNVKTPKLNLVKTFPARNEKGVSTQAAPYVEFDKTLYEGAKFNNITLTETNSRKQIQGKVTLVGKRLTFTPTEDLQSMTSYTFEVPKESVVNKWKVTYNQDIKYSFVTGVNPKEVKYLLVWDNDGGYVSFLLDEHPRITYDLNKSLINCVTRKHEVSFPMQKVRKYTLSISPDSQTGIEDIVANKKDIGKMSRQSDILLFENFKAGTQIRIYSVNGKLRNVYQIDGEGKLTISTNDWEPGVFLINTGSVTYKIIKK